MKPLDRILTAFMFALALVGAGACSPEQPTDTETTTTTSGGGSNECAAGEVYAAPGCGPPSEGIIEVDAGCYPTCTTEGEPCSDGGMCSRVFYDPCYISPCDACGADQLLCVE